MIKRMRSAWIGIAMLAACSFIAEAAEARGAGASRSCLTSGARNLLSRIEQNFGRVQVISTCRPGARIRGTGKISRHASGNAVDFNAGSKKGAIVRWLIANHRSGGTMTYPGMNHIHVDIGPRFVSLAGSRTRVASRSRARNRSYAASRATSRTRTASRSRAWTKRMAMGAARKSRRQASVSSSVGR